MLIAKTTSRVIQTTQEEEIIKIERTLIPNQHHIPKSTTNTKYKSNIKTKKIQPPTDQCQLSQAQ